MAAYYTYLISSLPMLHFGNRPPLTFKEFLTECTGLIPDEETDLLKKISKGDEALYETGQPTLKKWFSFEVSLRNELARIRSSRKHEPASKYLRKDGFTDSFVAHLAISAYRNPSILGSEEALDEARWRVLDGLTVGHYFDLDFLIIYSLKLLILNRWERIHAAEKAHLLEDRLYKIEATGQKSRDAS